MRYAKDFPEQLAALVIEVVALPHMVSGESDEVGVTIPGCFDGRYSSVHLQPHAQHLSVALP